MGASAQGALLVLERELRREVGAAARAAQEKLRAVAALKDQLEAVTAQADEVAARLLDLQAAAATWAVRAPVAGAGWSQSLLVRRAALSKEQALRRSAEQLAAARGKACDKACKAASAASAATTSELQRAGEHR
jgi:hypothetical protein